MGKRAGLTGARSGLFYHVLRVADAYGATWVFLENVSDVCANGLNLVVGALEEQGCRVSIVGGRVDRRARWVRHTSGTGFSYSRSGAVAPPRQL